MANPYYIPRENQALDFMKMGLQLYGLKQQGEIEAKRASLTEKELGMKGQQFDQEMILKSGNQALDQRRVGALEQGNVLHAQTNQINAMKLNPREKNWGMGDHVLMSNKFRQVGFEPEKITFLQELKKVAADDNVNRGALAEQLAATWETGAKQEFTTSLAENIDSILKKDPNADVTKQIEVLKAIESIPGDKVMETFFPDIVQFDAAEAAKTKTATPLSFEQFVVAKGRAEGKTEAEIAATLKAARPEANTPLEKVVGPDGKPVLTPRDQAAGMTPFTEKSGQPTTNSVTERGEFPIWQDPNTLSTYVVKPNGEKAVYDPKIHGKQISKTLNQTTIVNNAAKEEEKRKVSSDAKKIGDAIMAGKQPPTVGGFGMSKIAPQVKAYLADQDFDLTSAEADWKAVQKHVQSMNSTQQLRLMQAVTFTRESIPIIRELATEWDAGQFAPLNSVNLLAARNGVYGTKAASIATRLESQIADLTSELGTVYKGGNSSTDESLKLAAENIKAKWEAQVLSDNLDQIERNLTLRENSMKHSVPKGLSVGSVLKKEGKPMEAPAIKPIPGKRSLDQFWKK